MVSKGETLLSASAIRLYGRVVKGLTINLDDARTELGSNKFLRDQLDEAQNKKFKPVLARIYGYSYLGQYTALSCAAIFLVHGDGELASPTAGVVRADGTFGIDGVDGNADAARLATAASSTDVSGVAAKDWEFSSDIRVWEYDRADFSLRLDVDSGPLERILIDRGDGKDNELPYFRGRLTRGPSGS